MSWKVNENGLERSVLTLFVHAVELQQMYLCVQRSAIVLKTRH